MPAHLRIAIDGPAGSGKSTIGERLARCLGYLYLDTGAMYRAMTILALARGVDPTDGATLGNLAEQSSIQVVPPTQDDGRQYTVLLDERDVTGELRSPAVEAAISRISGHPRVRAAMRERQRALAGERGVVMVGRDIGTVVLPDADLKIYLMVAAAERARRRYADLVLAQGAAAPPYEEVLAEIERRDELDAPQMRIADDAVRIHTDDVQAGDVVARILELVQDVSRVKGHAL
ncbi:MAG TPA: (d)CMP kinase [Ktedonobacterales bacterium]|jgi:cytidylate kinase